MRFGTLSTYLNRQRDIYLRKGLPNKAEIVSIEYGKMVVRLIIHGLLFDIQHKETSICFVIKRLIMLWFALSLPPVASRQSPVPPQTLRERTSLFLVLVCFSREACLRHNGRGQWNLDKSIDWFGCMISIYRCIRGFVFPKPTS